MASFKRSVRGMMELKQRKYRPKGTDGGGWMPARSNAIRLRTGALL